MRTLKNDSKDVVSQREEGMLQPEGWIPPCGNFISIHEHAARNAKEEEGEKKLKKKEAKVEWTSPAL